ncbi:MAG: M50 family metallopeptidase [Nocardioidaceae bacterium]|nr:M50 family metallopeptidase [Nocardioidaceae bacterium]
MTARPQLINSTVAFALAALLMITVHEFGHAVAALLVGVDPTVYPFSVAADGGSDHDQAFIALAGPVVSLVVGAAVIALPRRPSGDAFVPLLVLWFGLLNLQEFAGYLVTGIIDNVGDVSSAYASLDAPLWVKVVVFAIGWALTYLNGVIATRRLLQMTDSQRDAAPQMRDLGLFAWLLGVVVVVVLGLGAYDLGSVDGAFEILGTVSIGIFLVFVRPLMRNLEVERRPPSYRLPIVGAVTLVVVAALRLIVLGPGLGL